MKKRQVRGMGMALSGLVVLLLCVAPTGAAALQDPMRPLATALDRLPQIEAEQGAALKAIVLSGQRRVAIFGDRTCQEGDHIAGYRIEKIEAAAVWVEQNGKRRRILLRAPVVGRAQ
ncbi:MAG: hypothetical protein JXR59_05770 [Desulfuromonadaceae bacterium]|nr:hypothetical protein [Desulfuromonadaceae bacterium]